VVIFRSAFRSLWVLGGLRHPRSFLRRHGRRYRRPARRPSDRRGERPWGWRRRRRRRGRDSRRRQGRRPARPTDRQGDRDRLGGAPAGAAFGAGSFWVSVDNSTLARIDPASRRVTTTVGLDGQHLPGGGGGRCRRGVGAGQRRAAAAHRPGRQPRVHALQAAPRPLTAAGWRSARARSGSATPTPTPCSASTPTADPETQDAPQQPPKRVPLGRNYPTAPSRPPYRRHADPRGAGLEGGQDTHQTTADRPGHRAAASSR
jgi:hypothetical protein